MVYIAVVSRNPQKTNKLFQAVNSFSGLSSFGERALLRFRLDRSRDRRSLRKFSHVVSAILSFRPGLCRRLLSSRGTRGRESAASTLPKMRAREIRSGRGVLNVREAGRALCRSIRHESFSPKVRFGSYFSRPARDLGNSIALVLNRSVSRQRGPVRSGQALSRDEILGCAVLSTVPRPALSRHSDRNLVPVSRLITPLAIPSSFSRRREDQRGCCVSRCNPRGSFFQKNRKPFRRTSAWSLRFLFAIR